MTGPARGEVQQWSAGRWRTVLTPAGIPVRDNRRAGPAEDVFRTSAYVNPAYPDLISLFNSAGGYRQWWVVP